MHSAATSLLPVLAAEKNKVPWFIAGGVLAAWAMVLSVGLGFRKANFPGSPAGQRAVMGISAVLVAAALSMAVVTSGSPAKSGEASTARGPSLAPGAAPSPAPAPPPGASGSAGATQTQKGATPVATTGTPAPPSSPARAGAASSVALSASATSLSYDTKQLSAKAGAVTITFNNPAMLEHNMTIAQGSTVLGATPTFANGTRKLTLNLKPGTYTFYCSVPGHRAAGMEGTLSVT